MTERPLILITNDDGLDSPGLRAAAEAVADLGELLIVAPSSQRTAAGRSYPPVLDNTIYHTELRLNGRLYPAYKADVSPAQAVAMAVANLSGRPIDLCISGINYGENIGSGVTISGTVGAALEAACSGIPALAMSLETPKEYHLSHSEEIDFRGAAYFTHYFARQMLTGRLPQGVDLFKVDVPAEATPQTEWRAARVARQRYYELVHGKPRWLGQQNEVMDYEIMIDPDKVKQDTDVYVLAIERLVSVVPMTIDLTAAVTLTEVSDFFSK